MKGGHDYEVVIGCDACGTDLVRSRRWQESEEFTELPGGGSRLRIHLSGLEEIERAVLSWATHATVIKPACLAARIGEIGAELAARYGTQKPPAAEPPKDTATAEMAFKCE